MQTQTEFQPTDWDVYATCYDTLRHLTPYQQLLTQTESKLNLCPNDSLLDVGCGTGNLLQQLADRHSNSDLVGIDFSPNMLDCARTRCRDSEISLVRADVNQSLPWPDGSFSRVVSVNALYSLVDPESTIREIGRVLKPEGEVVVVTPKKGFDNGLILKAHAGSSEPDATWRDAHASAEREELLIRKAIPDQVLAEQMLYIAIHNRRIAGTLKFHFFTPTELRQLFLDNGFEVLSIEPAYADQDILVHARKEAK